MAEVAVKEEAPAQPKAEVIVAISNALRMDHLYLPNDILLVSGSLPKEEILEIIRRYL